MDCFFEKIKKLTKKTRNYTIYAIVFFMLGALCFGWAYYITKNTKDNGRTLHELIAQGSSKEKEIVNLTITEKPYVFAEYETDQKSYKYYFLMDQDYLYIGYLDYETYLKLNQDNITENPIMIQGVTKKIPNNVIDIAIEVYNEKLEEEFLTKDNYKSYIGEICIDTVSELVDNIFQIILGIMFIIIGLVYLINYIVKNGKIKKLKNNTIVWNQLREELENSQTKEYYKIGLCLTPNYIVDSLKGITMISYSDIVWIYLHEHKYNGVTCNRYLIVVTQDKKKIQIAELNGLHPKEKNIYTEIIENIYQYNPNILIGYTKDNIDKVKSLY